MSLALDGDLNFSNEVADRLVVYPNGRIRPVHPAGPGIMAAPFVAVFSLGDRLSGHSVIENRAHLGGSWSYFGYLVASTGALMGSLLLAARSTLATTRALSPQFLILILAGSGIPYYGLRKFTFGHSFEFLAATLVLWGVLRLRQQNRSSLQSSLLIAAGVAFSLLVRPANVNVVLLPVIVHLLLDFVPETSAGPRADKSAFGWLSGGTVLGLVGTFVANSFLYGTPYPSFRQQYLSPIATSVEAASAAAETSTRGLVAAAFELGSDTAPRALTAVSRVSDLHTIVFTQEYGLFWFMPIVPIGLLLLILSLVMLWRRRERRWTIALTAISAAAYAAVPLGVVLVWQSHASNFGFRYLFSLVPLGLFGLVLWSTLCERLTFALRPILGLLGLLAAFSLFGQAFHGTGPDLALDAVRENSFGRPVPGGNPTFASSLLAALFRPEAWANMIARGLPGFVALVLLPIGTLGALGVRAGIVPQRRAKSVLELASEYDAVLNAAAPGTIVATLLLFGIVVPAAVIWITQTLRRRVQDAELGVKE